MAIIKAPLKPQQRLFALESSSIPKLYHQLVLGDVLIGSLNRVNVVIRSAIRKWLNLPHDVPNALWMPTGLLVDTGRKNRMWTHEENLIMARREAEMAIAGERFLNLELAKEFQHRSYDSIKSHSVTRNYKELVQTALEIVRGEQCEPPRPRERGGHSAAQQREEDPFLAFFKSLDAPAEDTNYRYKSLMLYQICFDTTTQKKEQTATRPALYIKSITPAIPPGFLMLKKPRTQNPTNKRKLRIKEYALSQSLY